ncbi:MAG: hypothetical protein KDN22_23060 [Verrucomicrobiae bacterium]|nr:hypothetical protein [Verrucomicrobiae bacterium]
MTRSINLLVYALLILTITQPAAAAILVRFDATEYTVPSGGEVQVRVLIDGNDILPDDQPIAHGLFSYGLKLQFPSNSAEIVAGSVAVASPLNYNGFSEGATVTISETSLTSTGNVALNNSGAYSSTHILTLTLKCTAPTGTAFPLQLVSARQTPTQTHFVDGEGNALDENVSFAGATVRVQSPATPTLPVLQIRKLANSKIQLSFAPVSGNNHFIDSSTDLKIWLPLSNSPENDGTAEVEVAANSRYFRLRVE